MTPKVSIIIPNYNHARYLERRLESVLEQTFQDFEVIYLDDASTDESSEVFAGFETDRHVRAVLNEVNSGSAFKQWNKGVHLARGEYLWIAEADDYADKELLATLVSRLDGYPSVGIAYCASWEVDEASNLIRLRQEVHEEIFGITRWEKDFVNEGRDECCQYLFIHNTIPNASAALVRRALYEKVGGADPTFRLCGDWMLWTKILLQSDICYVARPLNYWRQHSHTVRNRLMQDGLDLIESYRVMGYIAQHLPVAPQAYERGCDLFAQLWLWNLRSRKVRLSRSLAIYRAAREVDSRILSRLPREAWKLLLRKFTRRSRSSR